MEKQYEDDFKKDHAAEHQKIKSHRGITVIYLIAIIFLKKMLILDYYNRLN